MNVFKKKKCTFVFRVGCKRSILHHCTGIFVLLKAGLLDTFHFNITQQIVDQYNTSSICHSNGYQTPASTLLFRFCFVNKRSASRKETQLCPKCLFCLLTRRIRNCIPFLRARIIHRFQDSIGAVVHH